MIQNELRELLAHAQQVFQSVYGFAAPDIRDYLVDRAALAASAQQQGNGWLLDRLDRSSFVGWLPHPDRPASEVQLFVYFPPMDIMAVNNALPLNTRNGTAQWEIDEGNAHLFMDVAAHAAAFQHYVYCMSTNMPLSLFHCDLQNQVDQFVFVHALRESLPVFLSDTVLYPGLQRGRRRLSDRYDQRHAQVYACRYMRHLHVSFLERRNLPGFHTAVREFFYKPQSHKVSDINALRG